MIGINYFPSYIIAKFLVMDEGTSEVTITTAPITTAPTATMIKEEENILSIASPEHSMEHSSEFTPNDCDGDSSMMITKNDSFPVSASYSPSKCTETNLAKHRKQFPVRFVFFTFSVHIFKFFIFIFLFCLLILLTIQFCSYCFM